MSVGILVVSHSAKIAEGVLDLARQMAPDVRFAAAGGTDEGGIGTSFDSITAGIASLADTEGVVVLCDLGSAYLTTDTALDFLDDDDRARVAVSPAPLVEGAIAAAVAAQTGGSVRDVLDAADSASRPGGTASVPDDGTDSGAAGSGAETAGFGAGTTGSAPSDPGSGSGSGSAILATVPLVNDTGLHARPAADFVKTAAAFDARVRVNGVDAKSLLAIMALALPKGAIVSIEATGDDAADAVDALVALVETGFGE